jgi:hypothetical protein
MVPVRVLLKDRQMPSNTLKLSVILVASLLALSACNKSATPAANTATAPVTPAAPAMATSNTPAMSTPAATPEAGGKAKSVREACAADRQKFCANADKPFRCMKEHEAELSAPCLAARAAFKAAHQAAKGQ